jgi:hypothetical protein
MTTLDEFLLEVSEETPHEPRTAAQERSEQLGHTEQLNEPPEPTGSDSGGSDGTPPKAPTDHDRRGGGGGRPERRPRWFSLMILGASLMFIGALLGLVASMMREKAGEA